MHWQNAILSSPSKRAARQNKYAVYVRYTDGTAAVFPKNHSGVRDAKSQEVEGFDDWVSLEEFEAAQQTLAADLPTECPHGHGDLIIDHDHVYCDFCKFSASR